jgi:hypothetical protein
MIWWMLSWTRFMNDMITLSDSTQKNPKPKVYRERQQEERDGRIRYRRRQIEDQDAEQEIKEYERKEQPGTDRVY